jgi:hypothetical protein
LIQVNVVNAVAVDGSESNTGAVVMATTKDLSLIFASDSGEFRETTPIIVCGSAHFISAVPPTRQHPGSLDIEVWLARSVRGYVTLGALIAHVTPHFDSLLQLELWRLRS